MHRAMLKANPGGMPSPQHSTGKLPPLQSSPTNAGRMRVDGGNTQVPIETRLAAQLAALIQARDVRTEERLKLLGREVSQTLTKFRAEVAEELPKSMVPRSELAALHKDLREEMRHEFRRDLAQAMQQRDQAAEAAAAQRVEQALQAQRTQAELAVATLRVELLEDLEDLKAKVVGLDA